MKDITKLDLAIDIAVKAHKKQYRKGGKVPYIVHPMAVMLELVHCGVQDEDILITSILHDMIEDTNHTQESIEKLFGEKISRTVQELTFEGEQTKKEYMASFDNKSLEALLVKVADRICNVRDFFYSDNRSYAPKYMRKADALFDVFHKRKNEIDKVVYGNFDQRIIKWRNIEL